MKTISKEKVCAMSIGAIPLLKASGFTGPRAMEALLDAVYIQRDGYVGQPGDPRVDMSLVIMIADGIESAAAKLRLYCKEHGYEEED